MNTSRVLRPVTLVLQGLIRVYRMVPHAGPPRCRYYPSCSAYALTALELHGPVTGLWLALRRLGRCHPWALGGVDHVPRPETSGVGG